MRSRTEAAYAAQLDAADLEWEYEPRCFADESGQYLPDFRVVNRGCVVYVEVKGVLGTEDVEAVRRRMEIIWASEPASMLMLVVTSTGTCFYRHPNDPVWIYSEVA